MRVNDAGWGAQYRALWRRDAGAAFYYSSGILVSALEALIAALFGVFWLAALGVLAAVIAGAILISKTLFDDDSFLALARLPGRLRAHGRER